MAHINYGIDQGGMVIATYGDRTAYGVLDYENLDVSGRIPPDYFIQEDNTSRFLMQYGNQIHFTRQLPLPMKNQYRAYFGLQPLTEEKPVPRWYLNWGITCHPDEPEWTAPNGLKGWLEKFGCERIRRLNMYRNPSVGKCYTFALPSSRIAELAEEMPQEWSHLQPQMLNWCDHGWN